LKKLIALILPLVMLLVFPACGAGNSTEPTLFPEDWMAGHENDAERFAEIYPVSANNPFIIASFEEVVSHLEWGTGILVFGFPDCPRCKNAFPVLEKAFNEMDMGRYAGFRGKILYYDIYDDREANNHRYQTLVDYVKDFLLTDDDGNPRIYVPAVYFLVSGNIVGSHTDTVPSLINPRDALNDQQEAELLKIYMDLIEVIEDCDC
jgi:hypothetical protein